MPSNQQHIGARTRALSPAEYDGSGTEELPRNPTITEISSEQSSRRTPLSADFTNMRKKAMINSYDNPPKLILPAEETNNDYNSKPSPSPGIRSRPNTDLPAGNPRFLSSLLLRYPSAPPPPHEDPQKEIESEEVLRREYEQKATYVYLIH
jgi:hypothetical protein